MILLSHRQGCKSNLLWII